MLAVDKPRPFAQLYKTLLTGIQLHHMKRLLVEVNHVHETDQEKCDQEYLRSDKHKISSRIILMMDDSKDL